MIPIPDSHPPESSPPFTPVEGDVNLGLHPKQAFALQSEATEILFGGAKGGGKSHLSRVAAISWCSMIEGLQVYLFRRIFPDLWHNHMDGPGSFPNLLRPLMAWGDVRFGVDGRKVWKFWNGSQIHLCHCQHDTDMNNYQGAEIHVLMIDQLEQWNKPVYQFLRAQVRMGGLRLPEEYKGLFPRILVSANPGGIGHNWVKGDFVSVAPMGRITQMPADEGGMRRQYILSLLEDNPTMLANDPTYEDRLSGAGSPSMVKALRWGIWDIVAGGAIDDVWNPSVHILRPFHIPETWRVSRAFDWGSSKLFSAGWWAVSDGCEAILADGRKRTFPKGTRIRVAEYYGWNGKDRNVGCKMIAAEIARKIVEIEKFLPFKAQIRPGPADSSIFDTAVTIAADMARVGIRWVEATKGPGSKKTGLEKLRSMLLASIEVDPDTGFPVVDPMSGRPIAKRTPMEEPGLFVFDTCLQFIETVPTIPRDPKKLDEADSDAEDHIYDETRYEIMTLIQVDRVEQGSY